MDILLPLAIFLPLAGLAVIWASAEGGYQPARLIALAAAVGSFLAASLLVFEFPATGGEHFVMEYAWLVDPAAGWDIRLGLGLDGLSLWLFALSALLVITSVLVSWESVRDRGPGFYCLLLLLSTGMLGVFAARDIILFYVFFEFTLIPLYFIIGIWGSEDRRRAANVFFLYTFTGSLLTFFGLLAIVFWNYHESGTVTFSIQSLTAGLAEHPMSRSMQFWIFAALFAGFAIKVPLFPLHTWLPLAHVQAPVAGSVLLAGVLLKIGAYGFVRFNLPMLPEATAALMPYLLWLSVIGILYGALVALAQRDFKLLIAYSSVSHLGFCMLGVFALNPLGIQGGVLQMINHGLSTGGLFALMGMVYERYHTREIRHYSGLARRLPLLSVAMLLLTFSSIGLPGLNGFAGEFLLLMGAFQRAWALSSGPEAWQLRVISVLAVSGIVLGPWYLLWLVQRVFFGPLKEPDSGHAHGEKQPAVADLSLPEFFALAPLIVMIFWIGLHPNFFLERMQPTLEPIAATAARALEQPSGAENMAKLSGRATSSQE